MKLINERTLMQPFSPGRAMNRDGTVTRISDEQWKSIFPDCPFNKNLPNEISDKTKKISPSDNNLLVKYQVIDKR